MFLNIISTLKSLWLTCGHVPYSPVQWLSIISSPGVWSLFVFVCIDCGLSICQSSRSVLKFPRLRPRPRLVASHQSSTPTQPPSSGCSATGPSSSSSSLMVGQQNFPKYFFIRLTKVLHQFLNRMVM